MSIIMKPIQVSDGSDVIRTKGDISIRLRVITIVGILLTLLVIGGIVGLILRPETFGGVWPAILAIISGAIFGLIGFIVGQKVGPEK